MTQRVQRQAAPLSWRDMLDELIELSLPQSESASASVFTPMTRVRTAALALVVSALLAVPAFAWTPAGHMSVAFVAYNALRPATRTRVDALLRLNPQFPIWSKQVASLPAADRGRAVFMLAATWADGIKWMSDYTDVDPAHKFLPKGPKSAQNIGYADKFRHQYWHFIDLPFAATPSLSLPSVPTPNAQERITLFLNTLRSTAPDPVKSYDLTWLLHIVGDIHQPLHGSTRVTPTAQGRDGDDGGNEVTVCKDTNCAKTGTLHGFWDESIGSDESLLATSTVGRTLPPANATAVAILDPAAWAKESLALSKTEVYRMPIGPGNGPFKVDGAYESNTQAVARERAALGAARLAAVLNANVK